MDHRRFLVFGVIGVIALVVGITITSLGDNLTYYLYPNEAVAQRSEFPDGEQFRLAGTVVPGSIDQSGETMEFDVTDGSETIHVILDGPPPSLFTDGVPVLLEGAWSGSDFVADDALIKHDENYETPEEGGAYTES